jgi:hypothetical protein
MKHHALIAMLALAALMLSGCGRQEPLAPDLTEAEGLQKPGLGLPPKPITVMTRNVYVGASLDEDLGGPLPLEQLVPLALEEILVKKPFALRAQLLAAEIDATKPDLIGLQEVALVETPGGPVNYLEILLAALEFRDLHYKVAGIVENATWFWCEIMSRFWRNRSQYATEKMQRSCFLWLSPIH